MKLIYSQTARDTYWVFTGQILTSFLAFLYTIFLVRSFSPSEFGVFSAILAFILLISDISDLGVGSGLSRFLPPLYEENRLKDAASFTKTAFIFQVIVALLLVVLVLLFSSSIANVLLKNRDDFILIDIAGIGIFSWVMVNFNSFVLSAQKKFKQVAMVNIFSTIVKVVGIVLLFYYKKLSILSSLVVFVTSSYLAYILSLLFLSLSFIHYRYDKGNLIKLLSFSIFIGISRFFAAIAGKLDTLMLVTLATTFETGIYSAAYKIAMIYIMLAASFSKVIAPRFSSFDSIKQSLPYLKKVIMTVSGIIASTVLMYIIAPWFVVFVLGSSYADSVFVFRLLLLPMALFLATVPAVNFLLYVLSKPQVSTFNTFVQLIIIIFGNFIFIPLFGSFGPAITLTIAYGFTFISATSFSIYFYRKEIE